MILTPAEAGTKWCPQVRRHAYTGVSTNEAARCRATDCMMWRWIDDQKWTDDRGTPDRRGFCGLAYSVRLP